jgi:Kef-type K+ transport system membrane component KefB
VIGLVILAVVSNLTEGQEITAGGVATTTLMAFGFLAGTLLLGRFVVPPLVGIVSRVDLPGTPTMLSIVLAFALAWLASASGSAMIVGAFAAGLLLRGTPHAHEIERGVAHLGHFFVPLFFVSVGAAVEVGAFNPMDADNHRTLLVGGSLIVVAVVGKFAAGYAPFWFQGNKKVIGVGMIPRGEVGLIFAQMGLATGVFDAGLFGATTLMVLVTTFIAPPLLRLLYPRLQAEPPPAEPEGIEELVNEP